MRAGWSHIRHSSPLTDFIAPTKIGARANQDVWWWPAFEILVFVILPAIASLIISLQSVSPSSIKPDLCSLPRMSGTTVTMADPVNVVYIPPDLVNIIMALPVNFEEHQYTRARIREVISIFRPGMCLGNSMTKSQLIAVYNYTVYPWISHGGTFDPLTGLLYLDFPLSWGWVSVHLRPYHGHSAETKQTLPTVPQPL